MESVSPRVGAAVEASSGIGRRSGLMHAAIKDREAGAFPVAVFDEDCVYFLVV
jgi:hypothetical protein